MIDVGHFFILGILLFSIGIVGMVSRRNIFVMYMSVELMLNAINLILVALSHHYEDLNGQVMALMIIAIAAAEASIFLALFVMLFNNAKSLDANFFELLKQEKHND
ncbi:NADH-quinone oxidoreductase subunit NuoK [Sulfurimonas sp. MAG313]|nr:NADH-quinone oxidoreductase subunit NuoK [Sulfurimonas sp. MAG313]MDF1881327.1 NADH-quinone oxidoreductase subunit NuoK [Sulfurimonas sp. MAG313]